MRVIGLNHGEFNSSVASCESGKVLTGCAEERFIRQKKTKLFPKNSLNFVLSEMGVDLCNVDAIAQAWNPGAKWVSYNPLISTNRKQREDYFYSLPDHLYNFAKRVPADYVKQEIGGDMPPIYYVQHHRCHAANAFFLSEFSKAAFLTADWQGELECITKGFGDGTRLEILDTQWMPHSIGMFYATFTQLLGYAPDNDEWRVMAMSAAQVDASVYEERLNSTVKLLPEGRFELDQTIFTGAYVDQPLLYSSELLKLLDVEGSIDEKNLNYDWQCLVARAMQSVAENIIWHVLDDLYEKTRCENLVLSGGFFMNSVLNGKVLEKTKFKSVYISHSPDDLGNSIGAALYVSHCIHNIPRAAQNNRSDIGPKFSSGEVEECLKRRGIKYRKVLEPETCVAELLSEGNVVALHQGRMEFGDRALGFRSILGDPRKSDMKDKINSMIKYRESYRPFAPATTLDRASSLFHVPADYQCNYMEKVVLVKEEWKERIPAVTHFDGSARLQTVNHSDNPYFYKVITEFDRITGVPVVLNTSFNINGEPIVLSPDDAVTTFFNSGLKYLMINDCLIVK
jgi:carbamoyltransferase